MSNRNSVDTAVALDHRAEGLKKDQAVYVKSNGDGNGDYQGNSEGNGTGNGNGNGNTYGPGPNGLSPAQMEKRKAKGDLPDGRHELQDFEAWDSLGFCFPAWKKWSILSVIFIVQCSMNFNASIYANGVTFLTEKFSISEQAARVGQMAFLASLFLVNNDVEQDDIS
ncbi:hypothetical protein EHS25_009524 [Saitozyma podzolica]|uniref:Major facilitator superfamily (MFS) profile domain-containing protein n=1 Tax=Saitozyma podzolica TaxID=1890683 RepID=A0A427YJF5_9TREE|nr:hypothetical protein EHS25_009524 [Saitozyma podzolica]